MNGTIHPIALDSPALRGLATDYPARYGGRVPLKIKMKKTVHPDFPFGAVPGTVLVYGETYECWVNRYGAVAGICRNGTKLGVKPDEFEVVEWHPAAEEYQI